MATAADRPIRVFIAEDNSADVYLIEMALQQHGLNFHLLQTKDGEEALRSVIAFQQEDCPDIALLDQNLPRHDGDAVLAAIRQHEHCGRIPIIMMSSSESRKEIEAALRHGAIFFRKAADLNEFMALGALVKDLCHTNENEARASGPPSLPLTKSPQPLYPSTPQPQATPAPKETPAKPRRP